MYEYIYAYIHKKVFFFSRGYIVGARDRLALASTARVSSKEETQTWRRSLRGRNTTSILMVGK